jgi:RluA family pseudouridine synthase
MLTVAPNDAGKSLLQFLKGKIDSSVSGREIKRAIEANLCRVNGKVERHASVKLKSGDKVNLQPIKIPEKKTSEKSAILYEDDYFLIYNKPAGITSDKKGLSRLFPHYEVVHRLDKETTGAIIIAKTPETAEKVKELFKKREIHKIYQVIVDGVPREKRGVIESYIGRVHARGDYVLWGSVSASEGREAKTSWRLLKAGKSASLIQCEPITGRTHQIRVHMKDIGHPVLGDYRYQRKFRCSFLPHRLMLHAFSISFTHPITNQKIVVEAPLPQDFQEALNQVMK